VTVFWFEVVEVTVIVLVGPFCKTVVVFPCTTVEVIVVVAWYPYPPAVEVTVTVEPGFDTVLVFITVETLVDVW